MNLHLDRMTRLDYMERRMNKLTERVDKLDNKVTEMGSDIKLIKDTLLKKTPAKDLSKLEEKDNKYIDWSYFWIFGIAVFIALLILAALDHFFK